MSDQVRPRIDEGVHRQLDVYRSKNGYDTINEAVEALLNEVDDG